MVDINDQLQLEKRMIARGIMNYQTRTKAAEEGDRGSETSYARRLMGTYMDTVSQAIKEWTGGEYADGRGKYRPLLRMVTPDQAAFFALKALFNSFTREQKVVALASHVGQMVEDEARFSKFQAEHKEYYDTIMKDFKRKNTKSYRHIHRVLTHQANAKGQAWNVWTKLERVNIGIKLLHIIATETDLIVRKNVRRGKKTHTVLEPTQTALDWVQKHKELSSMLHPDRWPCVIEPDPWTALDQGGYYSPEMRRRCNLMRPVSDKHKGMLEKSDLRKVFASINTVQQTPWQINSDVLGVAKDVWEKGLRVGLPPMEPLDIPPSPVKDMNKEDLTAEQLEAFNEWKREASLIHTMEKERVSKCFQVVRVMQMAGEYEEMKQFWYVYTMDFRGRIYAATTGLSPQGPDFAKGLLRFAEGKPLGERGWHWLKVHGANTFGYDKDSYVGRVQWIDERRDDIFRTADDPLRMRDFWGSADKPYQFLAFCFEYAAAERSGDPCEFVSHLPVALDGSCNGLQHFSAMLRDTRGAAATNLQDQAQPADIYTEVADVCNRKLCTSADPMAERWRVFMGKHGDGSISRSLTKRPVMTLPYGSTRQSCTSYIVDYLLESDREFFGKETFKAGVWLTPLLWDSIGEVVVAARDAMGWLQDCAGRIAKEGHHASWVTPMGLPVEQPTFKLKTRRIDTLLAGRFQLRLGEIQNQCDVRKSRQGISPNFVHSMDAAHEQMTMLSASHTYGIKNFAVIHDSFGTHACDTDDFHRVIREAFVSMYKKNRPLEEFKEWVEVDTGMDLPDVPSQGDFDIQQVLRSKFFFG